MVHAVLRGRLGNWLFQYAAARQLAERRGARVGLVLSDVRAPLDPFAWGTRRRLARVGVRAPGRLRAPHALPVHRELSAGYDPSVSGLPGDVVLVGHFQSPAYFDGIADALRAELRAALLTHEARRPDVAPALAAETSVGVHVRRTDYLRSPLHHVCTAEFYGAALERVRAEVPGARFYLFSDDLEWCRGQPCFTGAHVVSRGRAASPEVDLALLARCRHHVIANSTFSWWAAWIAASPGQRVVAPSRWFSDDAMNVSAMRHTLPEAWVRLPG